MKEGRSTRRSGSIFIQIKLILSAKNVMTIEKNTLTAISRVVYTINKMKS